jgi:hypothetical protein
MFRRASSWANECRISYVPSWDRSSTVERAQLGDSRNRIVTMVLPRRRRRSGERSITMKYLGFGPVEGGVCLR